MTIMKPNEIKNLPHSPGVYIYKNKSGEIIYIGKATSLKNRVGSYFVGAHDTKTEKLVSQIYNLDYKITDTVLEALILESNLIKKHQPKYNIQQKDDKSFSYFILTNDQFPRFIILRQTDLEDNKQIIKHQFGPYISKKQMLIALGILRKIFPFHALKQKTESGCLDFQIGRCPGPYADKISVVDYNKNIRGIKMILEGKKNGLIKKMEQEMKELSKQQEFEKAALLRNKIFALQHIQDIALISEDKKLTDKTEDFRIEAYDISNISGQFAVGSMVVAVNGEMDKSQYRKFKIKTVEGSNDVGMMKEVLTRRFNNPWTMPQLILLDGGKGHLNMGRKVLDSLNLKIPVVGVAKGPTRKKLELHAHFYNQKDKVIKTLQNDQMIGNIMDEAHRFAITYHRKLRSGGLK